MIEDYPEFLKRVASTVKVHASIPRGYAKLVNEAKIRGGLGEVLASSSDAADQGPPSNAQSGTALLSLSRQRRELYLRRREVQSAESTRADDTIGSTETRRRPPRRPVVSRTGPSGSPFESENRRAKLLATGGRTKRETDAAGSKRDGGDSDNENPEPNRLDRSPTPTASDPRVTTTISMGRKRQARSNNPPTRLKLVNAPPSLTNVQQTGPAPPQGPSGFPHSSRFQQPLPSAPLTARSDVSMDLIPTFSDVRPKAPPSHNQPPPPTPTRKRRAPSVNGDLPSLSSHARNADGGHAEPSKAGSARPLASPVLAINPGIVDWLKSSGGEDNGAATDSGESSPDRRKRLKREQRRFEAAGRSLRNYNRGISGPRRGMLRL